MLTSLFKVSSVYSRQISLRSNINSSFCRRALSSESATAKPVEEIAASAAESSSSSFVQRFTGFLVGCGVGFGASFYLISEELKESNAAFETTLKNLEDRIRKLEKK